MSDVKLKYGEEVEKIPGFLLWQVSKLWQKHLGIALKDLHLSSTQAVILGNIVRLTDEKKQVTQIMLSEATKIDPMTTSQAIRTLEKKILIKRVIAKEDKRAYYIHPTKKGVTIAMESLKRFVSTHAIFFKSLENDREKVVIYLERLIQANSI